MTKAKKIFLLQERRETWRVRLGKKQRALCGQCGEETIWLTCAEAALASEISEREIFRLVENCEIHFVESVTGLLLVCDRSLKTFCLTSKQQK